jgi:hypothetical protein
MNPHHNDLHKDASNEALILCGIQNVLVIRFIVVLNGADILGKFILIFYNTFNRSSKIEHCVVHDCNTCACTHTCTHISCYTVVA